jgi:hypothetical protein
LFEFPTRYGPSFYRRADEREWREDHVDTRRTVIPRRGGRVLD